MLLRKIKENKKGFTLAELLVVVAIIAILVAVSIPIFTGRLEEARKNTDLANERAAKAAAIADYMQSEKRDSYYRFYDAETGTMVEPDTSKVNGYNQTKMPGHGGAQRNNHVIAIDIRENESEGKPEITLQWHDLKKDLITQGE